MTEGARVLSGRYEIRSRIGEGGMASVFQGSDRLLGRTVAVKVLAPRFAKDQTFVERFRREARAAAGLNHPNVVSVFDTGSDNGVQYIVMEHVEGRTLADSIGEEGAIPPARAAEIAVAVCRALSSAHEKQMVHRDVKPGNVLLTADGSVKVADFGIASVATGERLTAAGSMLGTASYISPEQAKGDSVDARSDIYSLGCVLYEMLTGRPPFDGSTAVSIAYKHVEEDPTAPSSANPAVPRELEAVVMKAMAKNPADRYQSAGEMAGELREAVTNTAVLPISPPGPASTAPLPAHIIRRMGRRWWPFALGGSALAVVGLVLALTLGRSETPSSVSREETPPATSAPPTTTPPSPTTTSPPIASVEVATGQLIETLAGLPSDVQEEIVERVNQALERYGQGDLEEALATLAELAEKVSREEQVAPDAAGQVVDAVSNLAAAMQAATPVPVEEDGGGPGRGKGRGHGGEDEGD